MPSLHWIGKDKVINHHLDVPLRTLDTAYTHGAADTGNKIIHGDNLEALKALLPQYEGRIKCIYIDPPYNTGNEGWVYNDNVTDPRLKKWLNKVVGKEADDLTRHDKWLCMMYPRLKLLHKLLAEDGSIWISIDDNEQANLKLVCDEIFGESNCITNVIWQKVYAPKNSARYFSEDHEYISIYTKNIKNFEINKMPRSEDQIGRYKNPDNDPRGPWKPGDMSARNYYGEGTYPITTPSGRLISGPPKGNYWRYAKPKFEELDKDNRIWWGETKENVPSIKRFLSEVQDGVVPQTLWKYEAVGHTQEAKKEILSILDFEKSEDVFITPKPTRLIERILQIATDKDSLVLDSFAGSGTTAHAVLNLNAQDGGNRTFILVEMEDYAETITAERVRRVMAGYGDKPGTGGGFDFCTLGEAVFLPDGEINPDIAWDEIRRYVWFTETRTPWPGADSPEHPQLLGIHQRTAVWFFHAPGQETTVDLAFLSALPQVAPLMILYADRCIVSSYLLQERNIVFKKAPRDIRRF